MASINRRQIAAKLEASAGTAETLTAAHHIPRIRNPRWKPIPTLVDRDVISQSISKYPPLTSGASRVEFTFEVEAGGNPANPPGSGVYSAPAWGVLLIGCDMAPNHVVPVPIGRVVGGPFQRGETLGTTPVGGAGKVLTTTFDGDSILWVVSNNGVDAAGSFLTTSVITGATSGATTQATTATVIGTALERYSWQPATSLGQTLTISLNTGEKIIRATGCQGTVQWRFNYGGPVIMAFTFQGIFVDYADGSAYTGGTLVDNQLTPSTFLNPSMLLSDGTDKFGGAFASTGLVTFLSNANDGDQIVIDDGPHPAVTYEFDSDSSVTDTATLQGVTIGGTAALTATALIAKINTPTASCLMDITAYESQGDTVWLKNDTAGSAGNVAMTVPVGGARITVSGMSGGKAASNQVMSTMTLDMANDVQLRTNALSADGYDRARIVDRNPTGTMDPDETTNAIFDFLDNMLDGTQHRLRMRVGSIDGRKLYFLAPGVTFRDWTDGDRAGIQTAGLTFSLAAPEQGNTVGADDEIAVVLE